jgi:hypothetical protein
VFGGIREIAEPENIRFSVIAVQVYVISRRKLKYVRRKSLILTNRRSKFSGFYTLDAQKMSSAFTIEDRQSIVDYLRAFSM